MTGVEFESFLSQLFAKMGYAVQTTPATGDQGGDLILTGRNGKDRIAVQAKRSARPVSNRAVQEVLGAMAYYGCSAGIAVTNSGFTPGALSLAAKQKSVEIWDGSRLAAVYAENFPSSPLPFDRASYDQLIERLRCNPSRATAKSLHGRWQDQSPTEAQVALLWRKDMGSKAQFQNWRALFAFAIDQHRKGDQSWSRGGLSLKLENCLRDSAAVRLGNVTAEVPDTGVTRKVDQPPGAPEVDRQGESSGVGHEVDWGAKGQTLRQSGRHGEALAAYEQALALHPNESEYWREKGILLVILERSGEALTALNEALTRSPGDKEAWWWKGMAVIESSPEDAFRAFDRAAKMDSEEWAVWQGIGYYLLADHPLRASEAHQRALNACEQGLSKNPKDIEILCAKGEVLSEMGRHADALQAYESALSVDPGNAEAWKGKGDALDESGRTLEALTAYEHVAAIDPGTGQTPLVFADAKLKQGIILQRLGYTDDALNAYDVSLARAPYYATTWFNKAVILDEAGRTQEALDAYEHVLSINSDHAEAQARKTALLQRSK
jgi:tetratricopeptide (TPR) repeat protein